MSDILLENFLSVFFAALLVTLFFRRMRLSPILGYISVGAIVGPHAFAIIPDGAIINHLANFGIIFLMFTTGLEFSLPKLWKLKRAVFMIGGSQVIISILITVLAAKLLHLTTLCALVIGSIVAMSSTAIVIKQLHDQRELNTRHGLNAVGILLFQDLAVVPLVILISGLAAQGEPNLVAILFTALIKGLLAIGLIFILGRWLLRPLFRAIAKSRTIELFTLAVLLVTLTAALLTHRFGLSAALGAFLAGMMLAETEFRHQIEVEIRPFRDILLGLFFITIGMLTDISTWQKTWPSILLLLSALVLGKMLLITLLCRYSKQSLVTALRTGLVLAQGGEFGFAILTLAMNEQIIPNTYAQVVLAALLISFVISSFLIYFNKPIATWLAPKTKHHVEEPPLILNPHLQDHVVICGYGRVGRQIARLLNTLKFPFVGLDLDLELVKRATINGDHVIYGDASHPGILKAAKLDKAKILVISLSDLKSTIKILSIVRQYFPILPILVRCRDEAELKQLKQYNPTKIIAEIFEESLTLSHHLLHLIELPAAEIANLLQEIRNKDYEFLR